MPPVSPLRMIRCNGTSSALRFSKDRDGSCSASGRRTFIAIHPASCRRSFLQILNRLLLRERLLRQLEQRGSSRIVVVDVDFIWLVLIRHDSNRIAIKTDEDDDGILT